MGPDGPAAFARLQSLAGTWQGTSGGEDSGRVVYRVTAGGSAVMETLLPGTPHEMVSVYYLDGGDLVLTHYCAAGNQPHLRLDREASTADELVFAPDGGSNLTPERGYIHDGRIRFVGADRLESAWSFWQGGKEAGVERFVLVRQGG